MWLAEGIYEEYRKIIIEQQVAAPGENIFISLEELQKHLALDDKDFIGMISDIKGSILYLVRLAKAPGAFRNRRRYKILGEEWVFFAMDKY